MGVELFLDTVKYSFFFRVFRVTFVMLGSVEAAVEGGPAPSAAVVLSWELGGLRLSPFLAMGQRCLRCAGGSGRAKGSQATPELAGRGSKECGAHCLSDNWAQGRPGRLGGTELNVGSSVGPQHFKHVITFVSDKKSAVNFY